MLIKEEAIGTAWQGGEYGVERRFQTLEKITSLNGKIMFDVGCGAGGYSFAAAQFSPKYIVGIDVDSLRVRKAKDLSEKHSNVEFIIASAEALPIRDGLGDIVLLIEVIEHVNGEDKCLSEAHRILRLGGTVLITAPNRFYPLEHHGMKVLRTSIQNVLGVGIPFLSWMPRVLRCKLERARIYSQKNLVWLLKRQGFNVLVIDYMMPPLDQLRASELMKSSMRKVLKKMEKTPLINRMGAHVMLVGKRT